VILIVAWAVIWSWAAPDVRGVVLLAGGVIASAFYVALYVMQRRRHW
jgi:hypothetical protein